MFYCKTVNQYRIGAWLMGQGLTDEDIITATLWDENTVEICCMTGFSLAVRWTKDGPAILDGDTMEREYTSWEAVRRRSKAEEEDNPA